MGGIGVWVVYRVMLGLMKTPPDNTIDWVVLIVGWSMAGWLVMGLREKRGCKKEECCYYGSYIRMGRRLYYCKKHCCGIKKAEAKCNEKQIQKEANNE